MADVAFRAMAHHLELVYLFDQWRFNRWWRNIKDPGDGGRFVDFED